MSYDFGVKLLHLTAVTEGKGWGEIRRAIKKGSHCTSQSQVAEKWEKETDRGVSTVPSKRELEGSRGCQSTGADKCG